MEQSGQKYSPEQFAARLGADGDPKLNAAADFCARLLNSDLGNRVGRVILFGSVAGSMARPESDVDVMVFIAAPKPSRMEYAAQAAWETTVRWGELVSPLTYPLNQLFQPRSYVVYNALKRGREIYCMDENEMRRIETLALFNKARRHLEDAQLVADTGVYTLAVVGAYSAAELAAKALLLLKPGVAMPYTHGGIVQIFSREYIKTGEVPSSWGRMLNEKLQIRSESLYDPESATTSEDAYYAIKFEGEILTFLETKLMTVERAA